MVETPVSGASRGAAGLSAAYGHGASGQKSRDVTITAGTTSLLVCGPNEARTELFLVNDSSNVIYLGLGETAIVNKGIRLNADGGSLELNWLNMWYGSVSAIAVAASSVLVGLEVSQYSGGMFKPR